MDKILSTIETVNGKINGVVWGTFGLLLLVGTGIIITVLTKFFQVTHIGLWFKHTLGSLFNKDVIKHSKEKGSISPFQALCTALAATVGTGNIAGVAAAICIGGAGAVFWMWVAAFFGMMTNYAENVLGIYFRRKNANGEWSGGAMYYPGRRSRPQEGHEVRRQNAGRSLLHLRHARFLRYRKHGPGQQDRHQHCLCI